MKNVRVEFSEKDYTNLLLLQGERTIMEGKKTPLGGILIDLFQKIFPKRHSFLQESNLQTDQNNPFDQDNPFNQNEQTEQNNQNRISNEKALELSEFEKYLRILQNDLDLKGYNLNKRHEEVIILKDIMADKEAENKFNQLKLKETIEKLQQSEPKIRELEQELLLYKEKYFSLLAQPNKKGFFHEYILPFLPTLTMVIAEIVNSKTTNNKLDDFEKNILNIFNNMTEDQKMNLNELLPK